MGRGVARRRSGAGPAGAKFPVRPIRLLHACFATWAFTPMMLFRSQKGLIGGNSSLSERGEKYARALPGALLERLSVDTQVGQCDCHHCFRPSFRLMGR